MALTNSPQALVNLQLGRVGLLPAFDAVISIESIGRRFKPDPSVYRAAAERLDAPIGRLRMIAAHDWDVAGALAAGASGAFVARQGVSYRPWLPRPDIEGPDLIDVVEAILSDRGGAR